MCDSQLPPPERPRIQLQPRTKPPEDKSGGRERGEGGRASSSIFGQAKPVDTAAREREIEERLLKVSKFCRGGCQLNLHHKIISLDKFICVITLHTCICETARHWSGRQKKGVS